MRCTAPVTWPAEGWLFQRFVMLYAGIPVVRSITWAPLPSVRTRSFIWTCGPTSFRYRASTTCGSNRQMVYQYSGFSQVKSTCVIFPCGLRKAIHSQYSSCQPLGPVGP